MGRRKPIRALKPPALSDPEALEKLNTAATAAGMSVEQLADLVFESGVVPTPSADGLTERYTLKDLGKRLWGSMQELLKDERAEWFSSLAPVQKASIIVALRDEGYRTEVIAKDLGVDTQDVMRTWNAYASQLGSQVIGIRLDTIAGQLQMAAERAQEMAANQGDHSAYWRIHKELVQLLQSIGVVDQAIRRVEVSHKLTDETQAEINALVALRAKQQRRQVEIEKIKQIEEVGDDIPAGITEDYDA